MKIGALFAGYGGLEHGVQAAIGGDVAWYSEIDKGALKILGHHYPDTTNIGDITTVEWSTVPRVDILTGGFPCQDVSPAGKRAGLRPGTRSGLWSQMAYAVGQLRPALVVIENVRGLLSAEAHSDLEPCPWCMGDGEGLSPLRALGAVLGDLANLGYDTAWHGLRAADIGAPHGRFRVFIVASPQNTDVTTRGERRLTAPGQAEGGRPRPDTGRPNREGSLLPTPTLGGHNITAETAARLRAEHPRGQSLDEMITLLPTPRATDGTKGGPHQRGSSGDLMLPSAVGRLLPTPTTTDHKASGATYEASDTHHVGTTLTDATVRAPSAWGDYADAITRWETVLGRPAPNPTIASSKGNPQLSPAFVEWMMGLPPGWVTDTPHITRNEALKALGNGVVPQQAEAALRYLLPILTGAAA